MALVLAAIATLAPGFARAEGSVVSTRHRAEFPLAGIVGLSGDRFLLWHSTGEMQVGTAAGAWTPAFRAAVRPVNDVTAATQGFLVTGSLGEHASGVLLLDSTGREIARWTVPDTVFRVVDSARGRFASTRRGLVPLMAGGALGPPVPYADPPTPFAGAPLAGPGGAPPDVLDATPAAMVLCRTRDLSMAHHAPGRCWKGGRGGWTREGDFVQALACGDWLITVDGARPAHLVTYALASGKRVLTVEAPGRPQVACAAPGVLLVGDTRLRSYALPESKPTWSSKRERVAITDLAATETALAYRLEGSMDVLIIPRPRETLP